MGCESLFSRIHPRYIKAKHFKFLFYSKFPYNYVIWFLLIFTIINNYLPSAFGCGCAPFKHRNCACSCYVQKSKHNETYI